MIDAAFEEASASDPGDRRTILIDGFNVLHAVLEEHERASGWWRRSQRERLLRLAAEWPIATDTLWVAFDGARPAWAQWAEPVVQLEARPPLAVDGRPIAALVHTVYVESADDFDLEEFGLSTVVCRSQNFLLFMTQGVFKSKFVLEEIHAAIRYNR